MNNEKVVELVNTIEKAFRELQKVTGEEHISAYIYCGNFSLDSNTDANGQRKLSFYRTEGNKLNNDKH